MNRLPRLNKDIAVCIVCLLTFTGCQERKQAVDFFATDLFKEVQLKAIFPDSKTFADCVAKRPLNDILSDYQGEKSGDAFDLKSFVQQNFALPQRSQSGFAADTTVTLEQHLTRLWSVLTRNADDYDPNSSLIPLKYPYIVPGGRFSEIYYWDSYFTMLGLKAQGRYDMIRHMVDNFAFLVDSIGFIPNGNRSYYLGRSQPPFFSLMVLLLEEGDSTALTHYLPQLKKEYEFWMHGESELQKVGDHVEHVVMVSDGVIMNRYRDKMGTPRPEAFKEDYKLAHESDRNPEEVYRDLRSAAESGWDFSSRWFDKGKGLESIHTTSIIPVDLNCLLYNLERTIAQGASMAGDLEESKRFIDKAESRKDAILSLCWDSASTFFYDYNFVAGRPTEVKTLAGVFPLFFNLSSKEMADGTARVIEAEFLKPGGLTTTLIHTGQQWDAPNGWAPLQWITYKALRNYKMDDIADELKKRWLRQNIRVFRAAGKMMEKYNVMDTTLHAGGGEYPNQDGFGWTNGVALALIEDD
jgi:alpha,alpha-trehalase